MFGKTKQESLAYLNDPSIIPDNEIEIDLQGYGELAENSKKRLVTLTFDWAVKGIGFGQFIVVLDGGRIIKIESERMSKTFINRMFKAWVDKCQFVE